MSDSERIDKISIIVARIDERTEWIVTEMRQNHDLVTALAEKTAVLEIKQNHAAKSWGRLWKGITVLVLVILTYIIEHLMDLI